MRILIAGLMSAVIGITGFAAASASASPSFPTHRAEAKTAKIAMRKCINKSIKNAEKGSTITYCRSSDGDSCRSGSEVGVPPNEGVCTGHYVITNSSSTRGWYCSGNVWLKWNGRFMRRTIRTPFFCMPVV